MAGGVAEDADTDNASATCFVPHCQWGTDVVRAVVAGELQREAHNAPLHLFSASPELVDFARGAYRQRSEKTSLLFSGRGLR